MIAAPGTTASEIEADRCFHMSSDRKGSASPLDPFGFIATKPSPVAPPHSSHEPRRLPIPRLATSYTRPCSSYGLWGLCFLCLSVEAGVSVLRWGAPEVAETSDFNLPLDVGIKNSSLVSIVIFVQSPCCNWGEC